MNPKDKIFQDTQNSVEYIKFCKENFKDPKSETSMIAFHFAKQLGLIK